MHCAQDVAKCWSTNYFESRRRQKKGEAASLPLAKRYLVPVTWRKGEFSFTAELLRSDGSLVRPTVTLATASGCVPLRLSLSHDHPYDPATVRAIRLLADARGLFLDVTAWVQVAPADVARGRIAGIDPGIIHPIAIAIGDKALLISGRAVRAEEFLHLQDQAGRDARQSRHRGPVRAREGAPRETGSRRWRKIAEKKRLEEAGSRRRVRLAANRAARLAVDFAEEHGVNVIAIGDPTGIEQKDSGRVQNRTTGRWMRASTRDAVRYRAEERGIAFFALDERGTSSRCPTCGEPAAKNGRRLTCKNISCREEHHRDIAGAQNIAKNHGGAVSRIALIEHRRVGQPSRRDRRRRRYDASRGEARIQAVKAGSPAEKSLVAA
jgi:transposase